MKKIFAIMLCLALLLTGCGNSGFTMKSNDSTGAVRKNAPESGTYTITCQSGHGWLLINDKEGYALAGDLFEGEKYSGTTFVESVVVKLRKGDEIMIRNFNSSQFLVEFMPTD